MKASDHENDIYDIVGIGFGPANLALAIAVAEYNEQHLQERPIRACFVERQQGFGWHRGMLLEGTTMQIAFPKDLATFRNPTSKFGFLPYLFDRERLVDFVNHQTFFPTRHEFHDYLEWAAEKVAADVRYGRTVQRVRAAHDEHGAGGHVIVETTDGLQIATRNVSFGAGLQQRIPEWATPSRRCFHNHQFLFRIAELPEPVHNRFVVLGAGQSAAEVVQYLHTNFPDAEVHSVFSRFGYSPADDSPYANRIFDPAAVDELHSAPDDERRKVIELHRSTNYSVVDLDLINELYKTEYQERVRGQRRLFMRRASDVVGIRELEDGIEVEVRSNLDGLTDALPCDAIVLATGFLPTPMSSIFGDLVDDTAGPVVVARDYRVATRTDVDAGIYLQGGTENSHGLTSSLLSNVAIRSGEIVRSIVERRECAGERDSDAQSFARA
ncbi:lysine N(6)-hydroxylase/L-ornithine N(5)-oxygenase family protein [Antrihabitans sp. YC3-6]|uniref:L-lysine N6-monooxygenase MbtG n=1 Tax=Antrihabitans stalagmiti TaxID=2799499 RepID=A0A934U655_9NOCA|nr:SidA/IucD/PvdA family monooxygenase [Antrihabitans stalagmiti]MBJ8342225.1 lysine N(6)-hydroxylase/L-ornithine N(5)-oxygenase family protein [Antrihabitans stalagmiti]